MNRKDAPPRLWGDLLCFVLPCLGMFLWELHLGALIQLQPDAQLYWSIAENVLSTGHFIQNVRPEGSFVVPFALPLLLTALRAVGLGVRGVTVLQYLLFGGACLLVSRTERLVCRRRGIAVAVYALAVFRLRLTLGNIFVEHYFLFALCLILWLLARRDMPLSRRLTLLNLAGMWAFLLRTVLIVVYAPILVWTICAVKRRTFPRGRALLLLLLPVFLLGVNAGVNHRETGHWILTDNYSGYDLYVANNPNARPVLFEAQWQEAGYPDDYDAITADSSLDSTEKNALCREKALAWIAEHPGAFLRLTAGKLLRVFVVYWHGGTAAALLLALALVFLLPEWRSMNLWTLAVALALAAVTAMGLGVSRYTAPVWPLCALQLGAGAWEALRLAGRLFSRQGEKNADPPSG